MAVWGLDYEELTQFSKALQTDIDKIDAISKTLGPKIQSLQWKGPDATAFKNDWNTTYEKNLKSVSAALTGVVTNANQNAQQQKDASS